MNSKTTFFLGLFLTISIFVISNLLSRITILTYNFIPATFTIHSLMLILSILAIVYFAKKGWLKFHFKPVKFRYYITGILIALAGFVLANIISTIILLAFGLPILPKGNGLSSIAGMSFIQFFLFVFIYASICEEILFRGFLQNFLEPLKIYGFTITKNLRISFPVIISGVLFGLAHLVLLFTNTDSTIILRTVIMTMIIGIIAGYFQEKHQNILPSIAVHMTANLPGLIIILLS